jgi:uncharacterized protein YceH (UPF0502 family)
MSLRLLSAAEARVLGVLVEKQHTVPDSYPLSLNALTLGCNQKTAREPVMNLSESEVLGALDELRALNLVNTVSGSRVERYEHNLRRVLGIPGASEALLTLLMLRGPQTTAELRATTERLHRFADISSVEGFLDELASHEPPFVVKLARAPGARENRWAHLLCGDAGTAASPDEEPPEARSPGLREEVASLRAEVAELKALVQRLAGELGISTSVSTSV